jgi:hypothetical protein
MSKIMIIIKRKEEKTWEGASKGVGGGGQVAYLDRSGEEMTIMW